jgi:hypothetical protein
LIIALIPLRTLLMPRWFTEHELSVLDHLTADNPAVLVSFGGMPAKMKKSGGEEVTGQGVNDLGRYESDGERSTVRERAGHITR